MKCKLDMLFYEVDIHKVNCTDFTIKIYFNILQRFYLDITIKNILIISNLTISNNKKFKSRFFWFIIRSTCRSISIYMLWHVTSNLPMIKLFIRFKNIIIWIFICIFNFQLQILLAMVWWTVCQLNQISVRSAWV